MVLWYRLCQIYEQALKRHVTGSMTQSEIRQIHPSLWALLADWESEAMSSVPEGNVSMLLQILEEPEIDPVWTSIAKADSKSAIEIAGKLFLLEVFRAAQPVPAWTSQPGSKRKKRLKRIDRAARELMTLIEESPLRYLSENAIDEMGLDVNRLAADDIARLVTKPDFLVTLNDLIGQAEALGEQSPVLRRPAHEDAHQRYFVTKIAGYVHRRFGVRSNKAIAAITRIMFRDEMIDNEVVRNILRKR